MNWNTCPRCGARYGAGDDRRTCNEAICIPDLEAQTSQVDGANWRGALAWLVIFATYLIAGWVAS